MYAISTRLAANIRLHKAFNIVRNLFHGAMKKKSWLPQAHMDNHGHCKNTVTGRTHTLNSLHQLCQQVMQHKL